MVQQINKTIFNILPYIARMKEIKKRKIYSKQTKVWWLHWFFDVENYHITMRLAGKPAFLLERFVKVYWKEEWQSRYLELLSMLDWLWEEGKSPFVLYINNKKEYGSKSKLKSVIRQRGETKS